jgi:hypothetical protein
MQLYYFHTPVKHRTLSTCAGQAVVQMARSRLNGLEYAIKFYLSKAAFDAESGLYSQREGAQNVGLAQFLPEVWTRSRACLQAHLQE